MPVDFLGRAIVENITRNRGGLYAGLMAKLGCGGQVLPSPSSSQHARLCAVSMEGTSIIVWCDWQYPSLGRCR